MEEIVIKPYKSGFLDVGQGHKIYYEACGNPKGKPILYVHGGPGAGFSENSKKYFDPKIWNIILFEQRGSGRSIPFASLEHNTTDDLVNDMNMLIDLLGIEKVTLFGGSWGSTLSLVYAIQNPTRVHGMVLRGIFIPSQEDHHFTFGGELQYVYPEEWERFVGIVPKQWKKNPAHYYQQQMESPDKKTRDTFSFEWAYWEFCRFKLKITQKEIVEDMKELNYQSLSPLEAHYLLNGCFLPKNYILNHASSLSGIPTYIIHGRYDMICQPYYAYALHKKIKGSKLFFTIAGHASSEPPTRKKLLWSVGKIYKEV